MLISACLLMTLSLTSHAMNSDARSRSKRYLVYQDAGPARAQFIIGVGVPVETSGQSVTVGSVIKFQYDLPTNSTEYTTRFYQFSGTISRNLEKNEEINIDQSNHIYDLTVNRSQTSRNDFNSSDDPEIDFDEERFDSDTHDFDSANDKALIDLVFDDDDDDDDNIKRQKRAIVRTRSGANNLVDDIETSTLSLEEAIAKQERKETIMKKQDEYDDEEPVRINRWHLYQLIEFMSKRYGYGGRSCILRTICEASEAPFTHHSGLIGEIAHILFTPSTTYDELNHHTDNEYHAAERLGRDINSPGCEKLFPDCDESLLGIFTHVGIDALKLLG